MRDPEHLIGLKFGLNYTNMYITHCFEITTEESPQLYSLCYNIPAHINFNSFVLLQLYLLIFYFMFRNFQAKLCTLHSK